MGESVFRSDIHVHVGAGFFLFVSMQKMEKRSVTYARLFRYIVQLNDVSSYRVINKSVIHLAFHVYVLRRVRLNSRILIITVD